MAWYQNRVKQLEKKIRNMCGGAKTSVVQNSKEPERPMSN